MSDKKEPPALPFLITYHLSLKNGDAFYLDLRAVFEQRLDFDERHGGEVSAHERAPALAYLLRARGVLALVRHVDDQPRDPARLAARLSYDREQVSQRALELLDEVVAH